MLRYLFKCFLGPHPETLNGIRKKNPSLFSMMDGMVCVSNACYCYRLSLVQGIVTHNFVIGSRYDAEDLSALRRLGISYVLNITDRVPNYFPEVLIYKRIDIVGN